MKVDFGIELAPLDSDSLETIRAWRNDYAIWRWCRQSDLISDVAQKAWFDRQAADPAIKMYAIVRRVDGQRAKVGVCGLTSLDWLNRRAEFSLYVAPEHQRKGYANEALKLLLSHAFLNLNLEQVWGESFAGNAAMKVFDRLGFKRDGVRRSFYWKDGSFHDAHLFSILREEWLTQSSPAPSPPSSPPSSEPPAPPSPSGCSAEEALLRKANHDYGNGPPPSPEETAMQSEGLSP